MAGSDEVWMTFDIDLGEGGVTPVPGVSLVSLDIEAAAIEWMRGQGIAGGRVYSKVPASPQFPLVSVQRIGGIPAVREYLDAANLQIDVWGNSKSEADDLATAARIALLGMEGKVVQVPNGGQGWVSGVADSLGLTWLPDDETGRDRYLFSMVFYCRGL